MQTITWSSQLTSIMRELKAVYSQQELVTRLRDRTFVKTLPVSTVEQEAILKKASVTEASTNTYWQG